MKHEKKLTNADVYAMANERILEALEAGNNPWRQTWESITAHGNPMNMFNRKMYRGSNVFILGMQDVPCQLWVTFKQALDLGGHVKKGKGLGTQVVYWKFLKVEDKITGEEKVIPFLRYYTVFNALRDCEGLEEKVRKMMPEQKEIKVNSADPDKVIEGWIDGNGITFDHGGDRAYYSPVKDHIQMPWESDFNGRDEYIHTLAHETVHATGHKSRLDRFVDGQTFGDKDYGFEELVAETGACYIAASLGYKPDFDNTGAYLRSWKKSLKDNQDWFVKASGKAEKAANMILQANTPAEDQNDS